MYKCITTTYVERGHNGLLHMVMVEEKLKITDYTPRETNSSCNMKTVSTWKQTIRENYAAQDKWELSLNSVNDLDEGEPILLFTYVLVTSEYV